MTDWIGDSSSDEDNMDNVASSKVSQCFYLWAYCFCESQGFTPAPMCQWLNMTQTYFIKLHTQEGTSGANDFDQATPTTGQTARIGGDSTSDEDNIPLTDMV